MPKLSLRQIADVLHGTAGLTQSRVYQYEESMEYDTPIKKQGGDGREKGTERNSGFRVCLWTGYKFADVEREKLADAMREAFKTVGLPVPEMVAESLGL